jgi:4-alpha-glucanotransferase
MNDDRPLPESDADRSEELGGILPGYKDTAKVWRPTSAETRAALLRAMGLEPDRPEPVASVDIRVLQPGESLPVGTPSELTLEDGTPLRVDDSLPPDLPFGYHWLQPLAGSSPTWIVKTPGRCFLPEDMQAWGWAVQLYAARSRASWGIGDLGDLRRLGRWSRQLGADVLLLNPLCAVPPVAPQEPSPYFPSSRRFRNPLYLNVEQVPGTAELGASLERLAALGRQLNERREIDRDAVLRLKMEALERLWTVRGDEPAFDRYCRESGEGLDGFACCCALAEQFGGDWHAWPSEYQRPDSGSAHRFATDNHARLQFHKWLQWLLDRQLAAAAAELPLVQDLPIGVDPGGADAWQWQDVLAQGVTVGAPPDQFNADGQDWSLPPFIPHRLRALRYEPFIQTIRASLRHAGGLRIDHVMGLFRLYWIPAGLGPRRGAYVRYPAEELLAIVAVESHRAGAWIAGEDLGTVQRQVRRKLAETGMLSYKLLWFEDQLPRDYPQQAMAAVSTHDLPTVAGLWTGADFAAQRSIGLRPSESGYQEIRQRLIAATGLDADASAEEAVAAAYQGLSHAPSAVLVANLEDGLAVRERPNMPGTIDQWPNWSLALPLPLEEIETAPLPKQIAAALHR